MRSRALAVLPALALFVLTAAVTLDAADKTRLLGKDTFMEMEGIGSPSISPDGAHIIFVRDWVDKMRDQGAATSGSSTSKARARAS
jgi:hypothetical protein